MMAESEVKESSELNSSSGGEGGTSSDVDGGTEAPSSSPGPGPGPGPLTTREKQLEKRIESLQQQNKVLKVELETYKLRVKALLEENRGLRQASVHIQAKAEQEEEFISNTLLKKIQALKKEKENLALNYEQEEECLTNDLSRKLNQLRQEKVQLEHTLEQEQECLVNKLMRRIEKLENETTAKQTNLEKLRREKIELENTLEQEQEALVNRLWKRMDLLETEKRSLQGKLDQPVSEPPSPRTISELHNGDTAANLANNIHSLRQECARLKQQLTEGKKEHERKMAEYAKEEREIREENLRLQRRLQLEVERREALCRHLSESESSLEMEEERVYNELTSNINMSTSVGLPPPPPVAAAGAVIPGLPAAATHRTRTVSSPIPSSVIFPQATVNSGPSPSSSRPLSPGLNLGEPRKDILSPPLASLSRLHHGITATPTAAAASVFSPSPPPGVLAAPPPPPPPIGLGAPPGACLRRQQVAAATERFVKPGIPSSHMMGVVAASTHPPTSSAAPTTSSSTQKGHQQQQHPPVPAVATEANKPPASPMDTSDSSSCSTPLTKT